MNPAKQRVDRIIQNYTECVSLLNQLFGVLFDEVCRPCVEGNGEGYKGVGCCVGGDCTVDGMGGPAYGQIEKMRAELKNKVLAEGRKIREDVCTYFEAEEGCILDNLKSPRCVANFCDENIGKKYGIGYDEFRIRYDLSHILNDVRIESDEIKEGVDPTFVKNLKNYIQSMIDSIEEVKK